MMHGAHGVQVAGSTYQKMDSPSSRTYIGSGKILEIADAVKVRCLPPLYLLDLQVPGHVRNISFCSTHAIAIFETP